MARNCGGSKVITGEIGIRLGSTAILLLISSAFDHINKAVGSVVTQIIFNRALSLVKDEPFPE